jgi:hypothetical protein
LNPSFSSPRSPPTCQDPAIQRLEDLIPDFVAGVMRTAVALRLREQELKERELERQKRAQEMIKLREQIEAEERLPGVPSRQFEAILSIFATNLLPNCPLRKWATTESFRF